MRTPRTARPKNIAAYQNGYAYPAAAQHEAGYDTPGYGEQQPYQQDQQAYQPDSA